LIFKRRIQRLAFLDKNGIFCAYFFVLEQKKIYKEEAL